MSQDDRLIETLRARLEAVTAERDAALSALETEQRDAEQRERLLIEEQDRFVTRLIENHESDTARLRAERLEATEVAEQLRRKIERARRESAEAEERWMQVRCTIQQLGSQREALHEELRLSQQREKALGEEVSRLTAELDLARTMLGYAIDDDGPARVTPPPDERETMRPAAPPVAAESGFVKNRERAKRLAHSVTPFPRQTDPSRPTRPRPRAVAGELKWDRKPPSSR